MKFSVHYRCACAPPDGKPPDERWTCPKLYRKDKSWNYRHGSAGFATRIPVTGSSTPKPFKRFGFGSTAAAQEAAEHVGKLLDLAGADEANP